MTPMFSEFNALLMFVDIIDSSSYSAILGSKEYSEKVYKFQSLFKELGCEYFKESKLLDKVTNYSQIIAFGDEGQVFIIREHADWNKLIYDAVKFSFELKARLKLLDFQNEDPSPKDMKIAVGIHFGRVMGVSNPDKDEKGNYRKLINSIIGYDINYAKRIESSARIGKNSQIFLSPEASDLLKSFPIALQKYETPLKGLSQNDNVFEVVGAFFDEKFPLIEDLTNIEQKFESLLNFYLDDKRYPNLLLRESWLKSFILSVIYNRYLNASGSLNKDYYNKSMQKIIWQNYNESDPIILFCRAKDFECRKKFTSALTIFKDIFTKHPDFIIAKIGLVRNCYEIIKNKLHNLSEEVFVRDTIEEFLEKYPSLLKETEKEYFTKILQEINNLST